MSAVAELTDVAPYYPPRVTPAASQPHPLVFAANFVRNPLLSIPAAAYEEDLVRYTRGRLPLVWITHPDYIKAVLLDHRADFYKTVQRRLLSPLLGNGVLTAEGADWRWQRQTSAPIFRMQELTPLAPAIVAATEHYIASLSKAPEGEMRAVDADMTRVTFNVISATLLPGGSSELEHAIETSADKFQGATGWSLLFSIANIPSWVPRPGAARSREAIRTLRTSVLGLIARRRENGEPTADLMRRLMEAKDPETGRPMSDEQLVDNLLTFYLAGHETTAKALTWTLYLLAHAPEWEQRVLDEVRTVAGDDPITGEMADKLVVTQQVLKESMRLFPPAPQIGRSALKDHMLGPHKIAAGTAVTIPIYAIQRHRHYFPDPDRFDPTRFAPEREAAISRYHYMPFGAGPRICIGMAFAMMEASIILATLIRAARFEAAPGHQPEPVARVTLVPRGGMPMRVTRRA